MKPLLLLGCTLLAGTAFHAQFSFLPYAGFKQSRTTVNTNVLSAQDINGFSPSPMRLPQQTVPSSEKLMRSFYVKRQGC